MGVALAGTVEICPSLERPRLPVQPHTQRREELFRIHRLGEILRSTSLKAFLTSYSRISQKINGGWCCWITPWHLILTFISPMGLTPANSHVCLTPWSVLQDGCKKAVSTKSHKPLMPIGVKESSFELPRKIYSPFNSNKHDFVFSPERLFLGSPFRSFWRNHPGSLS